MKISMLTLLTIVFIVLKLCHVIAWSWWWVLMPTLVELTIAGVLVFVTGVIFTLVHARK